MSTVTNAALTRESTVSDADTNPAPAGPTAASKRFRARIKRRDQRITRRVQGIFKKMLNIVTWPLKIFHPTQLLRAAGTSGASVIGGTRLIDCTHPITQDTFTYAACKPGADQDTFMLDGSKHPCSDGKFMSVVMQDTRKPEGDGYAKCMYRMACDAGTHIGSPAHWFEGKRDISELTLYELSARGAVIDVSKQCADDPNYELTVEDIEDFEDEYGEIHPKSLVCMKTGWDSKFEDHASYLSTFPGFGVDAAEFLLNTRKIVGIGIDAASIDPSHQSPTNPVHNLVLGADKYTIENLKLSDVPPGLSSSFVSLPMHIKGGPEAGARVVAILH